MIIAVASQDQRHITGHTGRCRKFLIYQVDNGKVLSKDLLELPEELSFHQSSPDEPHPLDDTAVLITGGMGQGLARRLANKGIMSVITTRKDPDSAVTDFINGRLRHQRTGFGCPAREHYTCLDTNSDSNDTE
ncbi:MAG: nitrogen fixation protein [Halobacteria archaeon]|nr:nitrogen fixation protein [Halobacteria archaeon]